MTLSHRIRQEFIGPLFEPTNNAGQSVEERAFCKFMGYVASNRNILLLPYHPLASDRAAPGDVRERVARNGGSQKKEPPAVQAQRWMAAHPQVYALFAEIARGLATSGRSYYSAKAITEDIRCNRKVESGKPYKIPNAHVTYMAIRFQEEHPELAGMFKTKQKVK